MDITSHAGGAGHFSFDDSHNPNNFSPRKCNGRPRTDDFGLPKREALLGFARTYLENQTQLWPTLTGTAAVPAATDAVLASLADAFENRFRKQTVDIFPTTGLSKVWQTIGIAYVRFSDEGSNPRSLNQQLINVLNRAHRDGVFIPWHYVCADAAVSGTLSYRRGYAIAKMLVERHAETGATWFVIDDLSRMSRNTIDSLKLGELASDTGVRVIGASDGFDSSGQQSKLMLSMMSSMNEGFIDQLKAKVKRGMDDAFRRGENIQPPGIGYQMVQVSNPDGSPVITHRNTIEKRAEIDPEAAKWLVRGAEMIAYEGKSPLEVARLFNENQVGGKTTWSDNWLRRVYSRERLVGREVFRTTKQIRNRQTGGVRYEKIPESQWLTRESPHLRILSDELVAAVRTKLNMAAQAFGKSKSIRKSVYRTELYPKVLVRPICGGCDSPMILGRSIEKYQTFCCKNAIYGMKGCKSRGYKAASIIDNAVLGAVSATLFDNGFVAALTADVNALLATAAQRPVDSTKKLELEIANHVRQIDRLTARLDKVDDDGGLDSIFGKVAEMERGLTAKREALAAQQRSNRRPPVKRVKEKDVLAALTQLRDLLQSDVGVAAPALKALVGDVVIESRIVEGRARPEMYARFTINAIPALALLARGKAAGGVKSDDPTASTWEFLNGDRWTTSKTPCEQAITPTQPQPNEIVVLLKKKLKLDAMLPQIVQMIKAGKSCEAVATALGISAEAVSNAIAVHRAARRPPARIDGKNRHKPTVPFVAKYKTIAAEVLRRRKAGEVFEQIARAIKASVRTIRAAHAFAMQTQADQPTPKPRQR